VTVNADLLKRTLTHIETHPDTWNQAEYRCRTGLCFAGWAAVLAGGVWLSTDPDGVDRDVLVATDEEIARGDAIPVWDAYDDKRMGVPAHDRAQRLLGLTGEQALRLFAGSNTIHDLRRIVAELCGEAP